MRGPGERRIIGVRGKLVLPLLLLVVLSMWLLGLGLMELTRSAAVIQLQARAGTVAASVESLFEAALGASSGEAAPADLPGRIEALLSSLTDDPDVAHIALFDGSGRQLAAAPVPGDLPAKAVNPPLLSMADLEFDFPLTLKPGEKGRIEIRYSRRSLQRQLAFSLLRIVVQLAITAVVLIVFINVLTTFTVLSPVRRLLSATERIGGGDLGGSVAPGARDEFGDLASSFNAMLDRLRRSEEQNRTQFESLKQAHAELQAKEKELVESEKMAAVGRVAAGVAHEVGNPLGSVTGYLAMLRDEGVSDGERGDYLERTGRELSRINRIMLDLLDYARPSHPEWTSVDINGLLRSVQSLLSSQKEFVGIDLSLDLTESLPPVRADLHRLQQMVVNFALNASQAMSGAGTIVMRSLRSDETGQTGFSIEDRGGGIPEKDLPHIFEPFFSARRGGRRGAGLGLAICRQIADSLGASLEVDSQAGEGAIFTVMFPVPGNEGAAESGND